jgi:plastocyanin
MRDRLLLPLFIPVGVAASIFLLIFSVSRILIYVWEEGGHDTGPWIATTIAIVGATFILAMCTLLAVGPRISREAVYVLTALPASIIIAFGLWIAVRPGEAGEAHGEAPAVVTSVTEVATDNKFSVTSIAVPANQEVTVTFENRGAALHNWRVKGVQSAAGQDIKTQLIGGGKTETVVFTIATPGSYEFDCEVHPAEMKGTLTVQ